MQATAEEGSGLSDQDYVTRRQPQMRIRPSPKSIKENQLLFTYFHFASGEVLTHATNNENRVGLTPAGVAELRSAARASYRRRR